MTEEEKMAIEYFIGFTEYTSNRALEEYKYENKNIKYAQDLEKRANMFAIILNLIQRLQEENYELIKLNTERVNKIKNKIEELNKKSGGNTYHVQSIINSEKRVLQEILKRE